MKRLLNKSRHEDENEDEEKGSFQCRRSQPGRCLTWRLWCHTADSDICLEYAE